QIVELISEETRFTRLLPAEDIDWPRTAKLYRRQDGTYAASDVVCPQSEIHDPWCSWSMTRAVLGSLCAVMAILLLLGTVTTGLGFVVGCPLMVCGIIFGAWAHSAPFCLLSATLLAVACLKAPKHRHPCYSLSLTPFLSTVLMIVWLYWWHTMASQHGGWLWSYRELWQGAVAGATCLASVLFSLFLLSIYRGARLFFGALFFGELGLQLVCWFYMLSIMQ
ncbi:MAG TPA: hypothetical protein V6D22_17680, partial [Candidatus Obscuribacterales bacterium]